MVARCFCTMIVVVFAMQLAHGQSKRVNNSLRTRIPLQAAWQFREKGKDAWYPATVPGCVHTDLLNNKLIGDPFWRDNESKLQWIGKVDWEYQTSFSLDSATLEREHIELVFEGLDTYADVFLNDEPLLKADNMFRTWRIESKQLLKTGPNKLLIRFRSPINEILPVMAKMGYELPAGNDQGEKTSPHTRKAPYQFGWDWGPRFVTSGVWRPVYIDAWNEARIEDLHLLTTRVSEQSASVTALVDVMSTTETTATIVLENLTNHTIAGKTNVPLKRGTNTFPLEFVIDQPALWWPNGMGAQPIYSFKARLLMNGRLMDQTTARTGIRTVALRQTQDALGRSFTFVINGVPIFAKGGNWIPADSFPTRITNKKYRQLLESVRDSNMNMLRVWGGGIYERDDFYELCDELGILVWQDFMFGCSLYPGEEPFLLSVRHEAIDNVKRLRNHPSIVIWVGNNEIESGWFHWGWKEKFPPSLWDDYRKVFYGVLPEVCQSFDPSRPYWPSSPSSNLEDDPESQKMGDLHFWQVWHAALPFNEYQKQTPRFMSEYGFQSFPQIETVNTYALPEDHDINSPVMMAHQRHPRGNQLIREYMLREYPEPKDFESFLYVSQMLQAEGIKVGAEHLRRIMPRNMGSLYWQLNDCWPVASWSSMDYTGRWKALQFYAKRFYNPILVSSAEDEQSISVFVVSDRLSRTLPAQLKVSLLNFEGATLWSRQDQIQVYSLNSKSYVTVPKNEMLAGKDPTKVFLHLELVIEGKPVSTNTHFFRAYKELSLDRANLSIDVAKTRTGFNIKLSSDKLARGVYLGGAELDGTFADNYFDLIPGEQQIVTYRPRKPISLDDFRRRLTVRTLHDAFTD